MTDLLGPIHSLYLQFTFCLPKKFSKLFMINYVFSYIEIWFFCLYSTNGNFIVQISLIISGYKLQTTFNDNMVEKLLCLRILRIIMKNVNENEENFQKFAHLQ